MVKKKNIQGPIGPPGHDGFNGSIAPGNKGLGPDFPGCKQISRTDDENVDIEQDVSSKQLRISKTVQKVRSPASTRCYRDV